MSVFVDPERCDLCGTCISVCKSDAIVLYTDRLEVSGACANCGLCIKVCPLGALSSTGSEE